MFVKLEGLVGAQKRPSSKLFGLGDINAVVYLNEWDRTGSLEYPILPWVNPSSGPSSSTALPEWSGLGWWAAPGFCYLLCSTTPLRARWPPRCGLCGSSCCGPRSSVSGWTEWWFHRSLRHGGLSKSFRFWCTRSLRTVASCQCVTPWWRSDTAGALPVNNTQKRGLQTKWVKTKRKNSNKVSVNLDCTFYSVAILAMHFFPLFCKIIEILLWIFSFAIGTNGNTKMIFVVDSIHHYRSLPNYDDLHFWEPGNMK